MNSLYYIEQESIIWWNNLTRSEKDYFSYQYKTNTKEDFMYLYEQNKK